MWWQSHPTSHFSKTKLDIIAEIVLRSCCLQALFCQNMHNNGLAMSWSSNLFLIHAPTQLLVFFQACYFHTHRHTHRHSFSTVSLCLSGWFPVRTLEIQTNEYPYSQFIFANTAFLSPTLSHNASYVYTLPLRSLLFHLPSNALCSVPFLPLPQVCLTPLANNGPIIDTVLESLTLAHFHIYSPPRFITSTAYSSRCFFSSFLLSLIANSISL